MKSLEGQFTDWVRTKPADEVFNAFDVTGCAVYQFLTETGYPVQMVAVLNWYAIDGSKHPLSDQMRDIIHLAHRLKEYHGDATFGALASRLSRPVGDVGEGVS